MSECTGTPQQCRPPLVFPTSTTTKGAEVTHTCTYYGGGADHDCNTATTTVVSIAPRGATGTNHELPFTGGDIVGLSLIGAVLISLGAAILRGSRRSTGDDNAHVSECG